MKRVPLYCYELHDEELDAHRIFMLSSLNCPIGFINIAALNYAKKMFENVHYIGLNKGANNFNNAMHWSKTVEGWQFWFEADEIYKNFIIKNETTLVTPDCKILKRLKGDDMPDEYVIYTEEPSFVDFEGWDDYDLDEEQP